MKPERQIISVSRFFVLLLMGTNVSAVYLPEVKPEEKNPGIIPWSFDISSFLKEKNKNLGIYASPDNFGKGVHWDTHGPWKLPFGEKKSMDEVAEFWRNNSNIIYPIKKYRND